MVALELEFPLVFLHTHPHTTYFVCLVYSLGIRNKPSICGTREKVPEKGSSKHDLGERNP